MSSWPAEDGDLFGFEGGQDAFVEARVLSVYEVVQDAAQAIEALLEGKAAFFGALGFFEALLDALEQAGDADLEELVEVAGRDCEELDALQQADWRGRRPLRARAD